MKKPLTLACLVLVLDQTSKFFVNTFIPLHSTLPIIKPLHFFNLVHFYNTGIAFSSFQNMNIFFIVFVLIFLSAIIVWLCKNKHKISALQKYAFCLVLSGGFGNVIDRVFRGGVVDFLDFGINNLRWPSFNVADSSICIAAGLIIFSLIKEK